MLLCPPHSHTSPKATFSNARNPPELDETRIVKPPIAGTGGRETFQLPHPSAVADAVATTPPRSESGEEEEDSEGEDASSDSTSSSSSAERRRVGDDFDLRRDDAFLPFVVSAGGSVWSSSTSASPTSTTSSSARVLSTARSTSFMACFAAATASASAISAFSASISASFSASFAASFSASALDFSASASDFSASALDTSSAARAIAALRASTRSRCFQSRRHSRMREAARSLDLARPRDDEEEEEEEVSAWASAEATAPAPATISTVTVSWGAAQPHTTACAGARCRTMLDPMNVGRRRVPAPRDAREVGEGSDATEPARNDAKAKTHRANITPVAVRTTTRLEPPARAPRRREMSGLISSAASDEAPVAAACARIPSSGRSHQAPALLRDPTTSGRSTAWRGVWRAPACVDPLTRDDEPTEGRTFRLSRVPNVLNPPRLPRRPRTSRAHRRARERLGASTRLV